MTPVVTQSKLGQNYDSRSSIEEREIVESWLEDSSYSDYSDTDHGYTTKLTKPMAASRTLADYTKPSDANFTSSVIPPEQDDANYEIKGNLISLIQPNLKFEGRTDGSPCTHLVDFYAYCETVKQGFSDEAMKLKLFKWSLRGAARRWLTSQPGGTFRDWDTLAQAFVEEYYPPAKTASICESISRIYQREGESLYDLWNRF